MLGAYQESYTAAVPKTRTDLDRDAKVAEILEVAERRLRDGGYRTLSVAGIARDLGIAQNAVYWYFPSKDHLFVAALERMLRDIVARKPPRRGGLESQVTWFVDQLAELSSVRAALAEQARVSGVAAEFAAALNDTWRRMLTNVLADRVPAADLPLAVDTLLATIQGALAADMRPAERRRIVGFAVERLAG
jgi:AcrR family transcriptional regulator